MNKDLDLIEIREQLEEELARLLGHVGKRRERQGHRKGANLDRDDLAHNFALRERQLAVNDVEQTRLKQIERALERIAGGTYGLCAGCGEAIPPERLEIIPYATLCIHCQQEKDDK